MIDGVSGVDLTMALNDFRADAPPPTPPDEEWEAESLPDDLEMLQAGVRQRAAELTELWTDSFSLLRPNRVSDQVQSVTKAFAATLPTALRFAPATPFNRQVSGERAFAWAQFSFDEMRAVKSVLGGTLNDLVLATLAGGIGRYLRSLDYDTQGVVLRAMCPVSMRQQDQRGALGNLVSTLIAPLHVDVRDPVERLETERSSMSGLKEAGQAEAFYSMTNLGTQIPPAISSMAGLVPFQNTLFNCVSTNVPGPQIPLYSGGSLLLDWIPLGIVTNNVGLFVAILSYNKRVTIGLTVDPKLIPDPWSLADALYDSYEEIRDAAQIEGEPRQRLRSAGPPAEALEAETSERPRRARQGDRRPTARKTAKKTSKKKASKKRASKKKVSGQGGGAKSSSRGTKKKSTRKTRSRKTSSSKS